MESLGDEVDDALFLADALIEEFKPAAAEPSGSSGPVTFVWHDEDEDGNPLPKRRRTGERRKPVSSKRTPTMAPSPTVDPSCVPSTSGQQSVTDSSQDVECSHGGDDQFYPVKQLLKTKKQKGKLMEFVEWEPCSMCGKTCSPQWVEKRNTKK
ncbi:uncharacterized protein LOC144991845 [Oryzias latipes]